jgi:DNA mismatch repair protein MutS2
MNNVEVPDWDELGQRLSALAQSAAGRALCLALPLAPDAAEARRRMAGVAELTGLLRAGEELPSLAAPEIEAAVASAEKGLVLGAEEVRPIAELVGIAEAARRFVLSAPPAGRPPLPETISLARVLDPPLGVARAIRDTFDAAGEIRDGASPELARLRAERRELEQHARTAIEVLMRSEEYGPVLQDTFFTIRAERYVLPLKASAKSLGLGIVHDTSRTGETVFVEPTALVGANNRLKVTELEIRRESRRILEALTADVAASAPALRSSAAALALLDARAAAARLAVQYDGQPVTIVDEPVVDLRAGRHPLLALQQERAPVVANDVALGGGAPPILVVSGPNAGGKTVLMKTVGLAALMARAGLLVAADGASRVGFFGRVLVDIGDRQSVLADLSTFSGHLANVARILREASSRSAGPALVLLDELMAGTNPDQGAALARATAEALAETPALAIITTHYDSLKALGESDARFANAGMEYDLEHLRPTFRLSVGAPGRSYAFDIAGRMGLPAALLERARALGNEASVGLESAIARLEAREREVAERIVQLAEAEATATATGAEHRASAQALAARERELARQTRDMLSASIEAVVAEARESLRAVVRRAQEAGTSRAAESARGELERAAGEALSRVPAPEPTRATPSPALPAAALVPGARVLVDRFGSTLEAVVAQAPDARGRVKVTAGALTIEVGVNELRPSTGSARRAAAAGRSAGAARASTASGGAKEDDLALVAPTPARSLDLRGQSGDEALAAIDAFFDRAALAGESHVVLVHGHGTGALRKRVREHLDGSPYVARWAPGTPRQGGDGATIVELR